MYGEKIDLKKATDSQYLVESRSQELKRKHTDEGNICNQKEENCQSRKSQTLKERKHSTVTFVMLNLNQKLA